MATNKQLPRRTYSEMERVTVVGALARRFRPRLHSGEFELVDLIEMIGFLLERGNPSWIGALPPPIKEEIELIKELLMQELKH